MFPVTHQVAKAILSDYYRQAEQHRTPVSAAGKPAGRTARADPPARGSWRRPVVGTG